MEFTTVLFSPQLIFCLFTCRIFVNLIIVIFLIFVSNRSFSFLCLSSMFQNTYAYANCAFLATLSEDQSTFEKVTLVFGAVSSAFHQATSTEDYLNGKHINSNETLKGDQLQMDIWRINKYFFANNTISQKRIRVGGLRP